MRFPGFARLGVLLVVLTAAAGSAAADQISISQVDPGRLLTRQSVRLYLSVLDDDGIPVDGLGSQDFEIQESEDGDDFSSVPITDFSAHAADEGITFFLLIDNSGSMYETIEGEETDDPDEMRISHAKEALRIFLRSIDDRRDRVQLASFNTRFRLHSGLTSKPDELLDTLDQIERPEIGGGEGWTELYYAIVKAAELLDDVSGRSAIVLLSDGENYPYTRGYDEPHPEFADREYTADEAVENLQQVGNSLFSVRYGDEKEESLVRLSGESGGRVFDTLDPDRLAQIYVDIRQQILREYRITYRAGMTPSERRIVRARYTGGEKPEETERTYFAGTLFGMPTAYHPAALIAPLLLAILGLIALTQISLRNRNSAANLEIMGDGSFSSVLPITQNKTVIGSSDADDVTLVDSPGARPSQATIIYDPNEKRYSVESEDPIKVNNQKTTKRELDPGDVINVGGSMVVFDDSQAEGGATGNEGSDSTSPPADASEKSEEEQGREQ